MTDTLTHALATIARAISDLDDDERRALEGLITNCWDNYDRYLTSRCIVAYLAAPVGVPLKRYMPEGVAEGADL